ncbi:MAG: TIM barrel protein [Chloroflexota bacterium]
MSNSNQVKPRVGISGDPFRGWDLETIFKKITQDLGLTYLDYWPENGGGESAATIRKLAEQYGVTLYCYNVGAPQRLGGQGSQQEAVETIRVGIMEAAQLGIPYVQFYGSGESVKDIWVTVNQVYQALEPLLDLAAKHNITLLFENDYDESGLDTQGTSLKRKPEGIHALMSLVDSPHLRFSYDASNFNIAGE